MGGSVEANSTPGKAAASRSAFQEHELDSPVGTLCRWSSAACLAAERLTCRCAGSIATNKRQRRNAVRVWRLAAAARLHCDIKERKRNRFAKKPRSGGGITLRQGAAQRR